MTKTTGEGALIFSNIVVITVCFMIINFFFQVFLHFVIYCRDHLHSLGFNPVIVESQRVSFNVICLGKQWADVASVYNNLDSLCKI